MTEHSASYSEASATWISTHTKQILICTLLGFYAPLFLWGVWERYTQALGFNATVFMCGCLYLLAVGSKEGTLFHRGTLMWTLPSLLLALSYSLYENPFFKAISILVVPLIIAWLYNYAQNLGQTSLHLSRRIMLQLFRRSYFKAPLFIKKAWQLYLMWASRILRIDKIVIRNISLGLLALLVAGLVIIPLLYTADTLFAQRINSLLEWPARLLSWSTLFKVYTFLVIAISLLAAIISWEKPWDIDEERSAKQVDSLISGILLSGILAIYALFIFVQIERLWVEDLPLEFAATENLVKTGFWQLVFLSFLNAALFIFFYRKTRPLVQILLACLATSSLLILLSAAQRMGLYVMTYGISYEKFYASYVVVFCAVLLAYLIFTSIRRAKSDILKVIMFTFIWMYVGVALIPVERIILETNSALYQRPDTRTDPLQDMHLSSDVYFEMKEIYETCPDFLGKATSSNDYLCRYWETWLSRIEMVVEKKGWHEHNIQTIVVRSSL